MTRKGRKVRTALDQPWWAGRILGSALILLSAGAAVFCPLTLQGHVAGRSLGPQAVCRASVGQRQQAWCADATSVERRTVETVVVAGP